MDRVRSETLRTIDATLVGHGAIDRPAIELPDDVDMDAADRADMDADGADRDGTDAHGAATGGDAAASADGATVPTGEVVRLVLDGTTRHCRFESFGGGVRATGAFDTPDLARSPGDGENLLRAWIEDRGLSMGRTVHLDVIEAGFAYGLRAPGESAVYDAPASAPDDSLASIAEELDGEK
jgi:hypothetical protein